jgi:hypothetical protein
VLIVFLVLSILISLTLGVFLYLAQDKITAAEKAASDANSTRANVEVQRDTANNVYVPLLLRVMGFNVAADKLNTVKERIGAANGVLPNDWWYAGPFWKDLMGGRTTGDNGLIGPVDAQGLPSISLADKIRKLNTELEQATKKLKETEAGLTALKSEYAAYIKQWNAQDYSAKLKAAQDAFETDLRNKIKAKDDVIAELNKRMQDITNEVAKQFNDAVAESKKQQAQMQAAYDANVKSMQLEIKEITRRSELDRIVNLNEPKAHIVSTSPGSSEALIDIGSNLKVPVGLTFSVHGKLSNGNPNPNPKADVEVSKIIGPQMAQVRVKRIARPDAERLQLKPENADYWITDPGEFVRTNTPLYKGDLLYNTVWDPNRKLHVALVGEFDLDGTGADNIQAFINILRNQGAEIDMYLDKANGYQPRGKIDYSTDVLIVGGMNLIGRGNAADALGNKGTDLIRNTEKAQREAIDKGVQVIALPRFLSQMGFSTPKSVTPRPSLDINAPAGSGK